MDICIIKFGYLPLFVRPFVINKSQFNYVLLRAIKPRFTSGGHLMNSRYCLSIQPGSAECMLPDESENLKKKSEINTFTWNFGMYATRYERQNVVL